MKNQDSLDRLKQAELTVLASLPEDALMPQTVALLKELMKDYVTEEEAAGMTEEEAAETFFMRLREVVREKGTSSKIEKLLRQLDVY